MDKLGDMLIGTGSEKLPLLCTKGNSNEPKKFNRFTRIDEPCRALTYFCEQNDSDAIDFIPQKDVAFVGFSAYPVIVPDEVETFSVVWSYSIAGRAGPETVTNFSKADVKDKMVDIFFEKDIKVLKNQPITIAVRYISNESEFVGTYLGYGGTQYRDIKTNEVGIFHIQDSELSMKGECDHEFGNIPRIFYF